MSDFLNLLGRSLIALLFIGGAVQKLTDPAPVKQMLQSVHMPAFAVWPLALFNLIAGLALVFGPGVKTWAIVLALYCMMTSYFHWQLRADPWQMTIFVKNWAIAGGLLILAAQGPGNWVWRG
ncbi:DoxX family protein [Paracoccus shanxieyensis]|uniref:DoxX family membrane protein n=1 Tax=Paracoccus shanxieyensis TaxID=2675752 RepID=A0A6L6J2C0_9RHOB|nr:DoxX family protein [Paracoccus shanxieyensis]MTH64867.1 DoxX family membrane protein [Paracoccus shanxieyensis]MTH87900.1 DoxX family membrane protein [Paracoccus shanxieyensis]